MDAHCGSKKQAITDPALCLVTSGSTSASTSSTSASSSSSSGHGGGGGHGGAMGHGGAGGKAAGAGGAGGANTGDDYGPTMNNAEGDDDDCKFHVKWSSTPIYENQSVTFTVTVTRKTDGAPATNAKPYIEGLLNATHPIPSTHATATETAPGVYSIGPIQFDAPGQWTTRFHFYPYCDDGQASPHGHAAFFVQVP
jgi:hypothetical protein